MAGVGWTYIVGPSEATYKDYDDLPALAAGDSIWVKQGTYTDAWDINAACFVQVEPGTTFNNASGFQITGTKCGVLFGNGCTVTNLLDVKTGTDSWVKARNGLSTGGMVISQARAFHDGGGWGTLHDAGTNERDGVGVTGDDVIVQNCRGDSSPGTTGDQRSFEVTGASRVTLRLLHGVDADSRGLNYNSATADGLAEGCVILDATDQGVNIGGPRTRYIGGHIVTAGGVGLTITAAGDNSVVVGGVVQACTGDEIDIDAAAEDCVVVANRVFGVIDDNSGTSTVTYNSLSGTPSVAYTGTVTVDNPLESQIVAGGETLIITLTNAQFQNLATTGWAEWRALFSGDHSEANDWDNEEATILADAAFALSATTIADDTLTITFQAAASYSITATNEVVTLATLDGTVLATGDTLSGTTFTITEGS